MSPAEMGAGSGQEAEDGDRAKGERLVSLGLARGPVERWLMKANGGAGWRCRVMSHPTSARGSERQDHSRGSVSLGGARARLHVRWPWPSGGRELLDRRSRPPGPASPRRIPHGAGAARGRDALGFPAQCSGAAGAAPLDLGGRSRLGLEFPERILSSALGRGLPCPAGLPRRSLAEHAAVRAARKD